MLLFKELDATEIDQPGFVRQEEFHEFLEERFYQHLEDLVMVDSHRTPPLPVLLKECPPTHTCALYAIASPDSNEIVSAQTVRPRLVHRELARNGDLTLPVQFVRKGSCG